MSHYFGPGLADVDLSAPYGTEVTWRQVQILVDSLRRIFFMGHWTSFGIINQDT